MDDDPVARERAGGGGRDVSMELLSVCGIVTVNCCLYTEYGVVIASDYYISNLLLVHCITLCMGSCINIDIIDKIIS